MKKIALLLVCFLMTLACIAIAEETPTVYTCGDYEYILLDDGTAEITGYTGTSEIVDIPEELDGHVVTSIGDEAFGYCESLTEITIPDSVTSIGDGAFGFCTSLTKITMPDSVTSIGDYAFGYCESLTEITIPDSVTSIGDIAFGFCTSLTKINIPDSVTSIGSNTFINILDSVISFGNNIFVGCANLIKIKVSPEHPTLATIDGVLFDKTEKKLIFYPCAFSAKSYSIPQGISSIGSCAFGFCTSLTKITMPDSVTSIGDGAFASCESLTEITIPDSVTSIGMGAFNNCTSLTLTVKRDSYAAQYAKENNIEYTYTDALDWLNS